VAITDAVKQATELSAIWDTTRDAELAAHPWTFAMERVQLPALSTAPLFGWNYAYQLPSDYLTAVEIGDRYVLYAPDETGPLFDLEGQTILTDSGSPLKLRYIKRVKNTGLWPALFVESFACRLAAEVCEALTQSLEKRQAAWKEYGMAISNARRRNAIEKPPQRPADDSWSLALRGF